MIFYVVAQVTQKLAKRGLNTCILLCSRQGIVSIALGKKYCRNFINQMKRLVFIDNMNALDSKYLYWLQKDRIVSKEKFLEKYI